MPKLIFDRVVIAVLNIRFPSSTFLIIALLLISNVGACNNSDFSEVLAESDHLEYQNPDNGISASVPEIGSAQGSDENQPQSGVETELDAESEVNSIPTTCNVGTICVSSSVSQSGDGSPEKPFKTIQEGAAAAVPGDTVMVLAGTYEAVVVPPLSGQEGKQIVFSAEIAPDGTRLVRVLGGESVESWTPAPEKGFGVFKTTEIPFVPEAMVLDGRKDIPRLGHDPGTSYDMFNYIGLPSDHIVQTDWAKVDVNYWDGIGALFGFHNGTTYVKFRDGSDPGSKNLRVAPTGGGFDLTDRSYITIQGFQISGFQTGVLMSGIGSHHNIIENNEISTGTSRIDILYGAHSNHVRENELHMGVLDSQYTPGAWGNASYNLGVREHIYNTYKHEVGRSTYSPNDDSGVNIRYAGQENEVYRNRIYNTLTAVSIIDTSDLKVYGNELHNTSSGALVQAFQGKNIQIFDNSIYDGHFLMRFQEMQEPDPRSIYIYRNKFWNPDKAGSSQMYFHHGAMVEGENTQDKQVWIYHNCFAGDKRAYSTNTLSVSGTRLINNIFSSDVPLLDYDMDLGMFDYNWVGGFFYTPLPRWWDNHNIAALGEHVWEDTDVRPDFTLPEGHAAIEAGMDLSKSFINDGETYSPLPGMDVGYFGGAAPNIGCVP